MRRSDVQIPIFRNSHEVVLKTSIANFVFTILNCFPLMNSYNFPLEELSATDWLYLAYFSTWRR